MSVIDNSFLAYVLSGVALLMVNALKIKKYDLNLYHVILKSGLTCLNFEDKSSKIRQVKNIGWDKPVIFKIVKLSMLRLVKMFDYPIRFLHPCLNFFLTLSEYPNPYKILHFIILFILILIWDSL